MRKAISNKVIEFKVYKLISESIPSCQNTHLILNNPESKALMQRLWANNSLLCSHVSNDSKHFIVGVLEV